MQIEKNIAFLVNQQFPAIYRESGAELVNLVEEYYNFLETDTKQSNYVGRRLFEYKDIATTISSMIVFFQKKYMADLPFKEESDRFISRNIMDLYRRKGTKAGIELFFRAFYDEEIEIFYPASKMFKPSDSKWKTGIYLQMYPNNNSFTSDSGIVYDYNDLLGRNIKGTSSGAKAVVDKINFIILNGINTAIIYIEEVKGTFQRFDDIQTNISSEVVTFGRINGSLSNFFVDDTFAGTVGNQVGDIFNVSSQYGFGGKAIVTDVVEEFTGQISYNITDGGFGYSVENTRLIVSDQVLILNNQGLTFVIGETLGDSGANFGEVIGQNENSVGVKMAPGNSFDIGRTISTVNRDVNINISVNTVTIKNDSSPGPLFADTGNPADVAVGSLSNQTVVSIITDTISDYLSVSIDAANYNAAPAVQPMSGTADPVTIATPLQDAFAITNFTIGSVDSFININPGSNYINDTFALVEDDIFSSLERYDQIILLSVPASAGSFTVGEIITEQNTGVTGIVRSTNTNTGFITITPYSYYGFSGTNDIVRNNSDVVAVTRVDTDYSSKVQGLNATVRSTTEFSVGRISEVVINTAGFGYVDTSEAFLLDDLGEIQARGIIESTTQGKTSGFSSTLSSHLNGYRQTDNGLVYYDSGMKIQDSDFYQEYSYEIRSTLGIERYEQLAKENVHLAGTKMFGKFSYRNKVGGKTTQRFVRLFNDDGDALSVTDPDLNRDFNTDPIIP